MYDIGDSIRLSVNFSNSQNFDSVDPLFVELKLKSPSGNVTTYSYPSNINKESIGNYYYDIQINESGRYWYWWRGTGTYSSVVEGSFFVKKSQF